MTDWAPFGLDEDQTEQYRVLRDGVPGDLREPLLGWLKPLLSSGAYRSIINERTQELAMLTGLQIGLRDGAYADWDKYVQALRGMEGILGALFAALDGGVFTSIHGGVE
ncbi:hypothetical protein ASG90_14655 [Nocardioides sp. Soil797]|nr:hypothetical protein ASG90_14655 [Nocardioides sp. Soil797]